MALPGDKAGVAKSIVDGKTDGKKVDRAIRVEDSGTAFYSGVDIGDDNAKYRI